MKPGRSLERLVSYFETVLADQPNIKVESPKKLKDQHTGRWREFDVVLTIKNRHHESVIAIECRDRSRPITVNQVEGFWAKCQHTKVTQGIIVSSRGFHTSAKNKAEKLGIRCLNIEAVESLDWIRTAGVKSRQRNLIHIGWVIELEATQILPSAFKLILANNRSELPIESLNNNLRHALSVAPIMDEELIGVQKRRVEATDAHELLLLDKETNLTHRIQSLYAIVEYTAHEQLVNFQLVKYSDDEAKTGIASGAIAHIDMADMHLNVLLVQDEATGEIKFGGFNGDGLPLNVTFHEVDENQGQV